MTKDIRFTPLYIPFLLPPFTIHPLFKPLDIISKNVDDLILL
jgi:hypothetical protein